MYCFIITLTLLLPTLHGYSTLCYTTTLITCPDSIETSTCHYLFETVNGQIYWVVTGTEKMYVYSNDPNNVCKPITVDFTEVSLIEHESKLEGTFPALQFCDAGSPNEAHNLGSPDDAVGFTFCRIWIELTGRCEITTDSHSFVNMRNMDPITMTLGFYINTGSIIRGSFRKEQDWKIPIEDLEHTELIHVTCGSNSLNINLHKTLIQSCLSNKNSIFKNYYLKEFYCNNKAVTIITVIILLTLVIKYITDLFGLSVLLEPIYALIAAVTLYPIIYVVHRVSRCNSCHKFRMYNHTCDLYCCNTWLGTKEKLAEHKKYRGCSNSTLLGYAVWMVKIKITKFLAVILYILALLTIVPTVLGVSENESNDNELSENGIKVQIQLNYTSESKCVDVNKFLSCDLQVNKFICDNTKVFGLNCDLAFLLGGFAKRIDRRKRNILTPVNNLAMIMPNLDHSQYTIATGSTTVSVPVLTGETRGFIIGSKETMVITIQEASCSHTLNSLYKSCDITGHSIHTVEQCTGTECAVEKKGSISAQKQWNGVQSWFCEKPGCLGVNSGCLGVGCSPEFGHDCCNIYKSTSSSCYAKVCVSINGKVNCYKVIPNNELYGKLKVKWPKVSKSVLIEESRVAVCSGLAYYGQINDLGETDLKYGTPQFQISGDPTYKENVVASYACEYIGYKQVVLDSCVVDGSGHKMALSKFKTAELHGDTLVEQHLELGFLEITFDTKDIEIALDPLTVKIFNGNCKGYLGGFRGLLCENKIRVTSKGVVHVTCNTLSIPVPDLLVTPEQVLIYYNAFTDTTLGVVNCTLIYGDKEIKFTNSIQHSGHYSLNETDNILHIAYSNQKQFVCDNVFCKIYRAVGSFFNSIEKFSDILYWVVIIVLISIIICVIIYIVVYMYNWLKYSYKTIKDQSKQN